MKKLFSLMLFAAAVSSASAALITQGISHFKDQPYWGGKAKVITENGKKVLELTSSVKGDRHFGRAFATFSTGEKFAAGDKIVATASVRGKGKFFIGILKYRPKVGMPITVFVETVDLTESAKEVKFVFELEDTFDRIYPFVQVQGEGIAYVESFKLEKSNDKSLKNTPLASGGSAPRAAAVKSAGPEVKTLFSGVASFRDQPYWGGKAKVITEKGRRVLELTASAQNGRTYCRAFAPFWTREMFLPETQLCAVVKVRGKGKFFAGLLKYRPKQGAPVSAIPAAVELTESAKEVKFDFEIEDYFEKVYPFMEVQGEGVAYVESFRLENRADKSVKITVKTPLQIITDKQNSNPVEFSTTVKNTNINIVKIGKKNSVEKIKSDKDGKVVVPAAQYPLGTSHIYAAAKGIGVQSFVSVVTADEYAKTDAVARKIKIKKPIRMLVLGDSLSDYYRGYNYIDRISYWINKYNPGKFSFLNAGVAGDFLERASTRMEVELKHVKKWAYRQEMYNGIFKNEYDYVFIWMGQNDTRCMRKQEYKIPETTPAKQNKYLPLMLKRLKEKCPKAKIVLIAPSPSNESVFIEREKTWAKSRNIAYYGKVEHVNTYDEINRQICKKYDLDYIDMLNVMRNYKPIQDLYVADGVHLSDKGGVLVADEILKYFAKEFK